MKVSTMQQALKCINNASHRELWMGRTALQGFMMIREVERWWWVGGGRKYFEEGEFQKRVMYLRDAWRR